MKRLDVSISHHPDIGEGGLISIQVTPAIFVQSSSTSTMFICDGGEWASLKEAILLEEEEEGGEGDSQ